MYNCTAGKILIYLSIVIYMFEFMRSREKRGEKYYTAGKDLELLRNIEDKKEIGHMCQ